MTRTGSADLDERQQSTPRTRRSRYHHGDLRAALLEAAEIELVEHGIERFSLRAVAKRAGVSHAAPAHHFGDITGLLTALAVVGLDRLREATLKRMENTPRDPRTRMIAASLGYVDFATEQPALFRLIFISERPDRTDRDFSDAYDRAFNDARSLFCDDDDGLPENDPKTREMLRAAWSMIHGVASLLVAGNLRSIADLPPTERDAAITGIMKRVI